MNFGDGIGDRLDFWRLIRKITPQLEILDAAILFGIYAGYRQAEIAKCLRVSDSTITRRLEKLGKMLKKGGWGKAG